MVFVFETELSFGVVGVRTPLFLVCFDFLSLFGFGFVASPAAFLVRGAAGVFLSTLRRLDGQSLGDFASEALAAGLPGTFSSCEVDDPDEQAVALMTNAITNGKDSFFSLMILLIGNP